MWKRSDAEQDGGRPERHGGETESVISIIGPGMTVMGDCGSDGTVRIEGTVEGDVTAGKSVVVGKDGTVDGNIRTQDAIISGRVTGTLLVESRLEVQAGSRIEGEVRARRMQLEEGAVLNGTVRMGEDEVSPISYPEPKAPEPEADGNGRGGPGAGPEKRPTLDRRREALHRESGRESPGKTG